MRHFVIALCCTLTLALSGCADKFRTYDGPEVTRISVHKSSRRMYLWHEDQVIRHFEFDLGFAPEGHKEFEGDGKTPEGRYFIDRRNPNSSFHLSLGISYPNVQDVVYARKSGKSPGGDIFIHGRPNAEALLGPRTGPDWTAGCISVTNDEMEDIYAMVRLGTVIDIYP
ncbi:hypothetical protein DDZ14_05310 [Maritimibacter sp. 55A14]|uniref:L,D-transpeptidase family protein n=1 Tax=Maritimibacter sp. 55A14 TaxID=2174844 RepID=UPI000D60F78B|nr:L,D-transpeptidase family protein [Maritimibacter sp. 55A14]PWE33605.1 hypothetical protein DDZ14_05310 [Maritimibacter sp. 55A14]